MSFDFTLAHVWMMMMMTEPSRQSCGVSTPWTVHTSMAEIASVDENSKNATCSEVKKRAG